MFAALVSRIKLDGLQYFLGVLPIPLKICLICFTAFSEYFISTSSLLSHRFDGWRQSGAEVLHGFYGIVCRKNSRFILLCLSGKPHAVLDVVVDDEVEFLVGKSIVLGENAVDFINDFFDLAGANAIDLDCSTTPKISFVSYANLGFLCLHSHVQ